MQGSENCFHWWLGSIPLDFHFAVTHWRECILIKIAFIGIKGIPSRAGADRVVEMVVRRLAGRYELTLYCSRRYTPSEISLPGVRLVRLPSFPGKYSHMTSVDFLAACHAVLRGDFDLIHLHNIEASFVLPILKLKYPVITTAHGRINFTDKWARIPAALMRSMEIPYAYLSNALTSVSQQHAMQLEAQYHHPVTYIPNGIDLDPIVDISAAQEMLTKQGLSENRYILFAAGRILPIKGAHVLIDAYHQLGCPENLVILGDLTQAPAYGAQLRTVAGRGVTFMPFIDGQPALLGWMRLCKLFVFPSIQEAMSITLLEAASVGAAILCSDIPANRAVLPEQALYFSAGDAADLASKLRWALDHPQEMALLGKRAQAWVRQQFDWDSICQQYIALYQRVTE